MYVHTNEIDKLCRYLSNLRNLTKGICRATKTSRRVVVGICALGPHLYIALRRAHDAERERHIKGVHAHRMMRNGFESRSVNANAPFFFFTCTRDKPRQSH